jgi:ApaG protein
VVVVPSLVTRDVRVSVESQFSPARSNPKRGLWFFVYNIKIENLGGQTVQLLARHWRITDAHGKLEEVRGPGVVGQQPSLAPGENFEYSSGCPLRTPFGSMQGSYEMTTEGGETFQVAIPPFALRDIRNMQ